MKPFSPTFTIGSIRIGTIEGASCVNFGNNFPTNFTSHKKQNQGFGSITGDHNDLSDIISRLDEKDVVEAVHQGMNEDYPDWIANLLAGQEVDISNNEIVQEENGDM